MNEHFHAGQLALQERFDTRRLAETLASNELYGPEIHEAARRLIEAADMFFIATADATGMPDCSYKRRRSGLRPRSSTTGRSRSRTTTATASSPRSATSTSTRRSGCCSSTSSTGHRLRLRGEAGVDPTPTRCLPTYPGAQAVVRVRTTLVYPNCKRYVHRMTRVERSAFVPSPRRRDAGAELEARGLGAARDALPHDDPARDPAHPEAPATPDY